MMAAQRRLGHHGAHRYVERVRPPFPVLVDPERTATRAFGIDATSPLGPKFAVPPPAAFLIDRNGFIRFAQVLDLRTRPDPNVLLAAASRLRTDAVSGDAFS